MARRVQIIRPRPLVTVFEFDGEVYDFTPAGTRTYYPQITADALRTVPDIRFTRGVR